MAAKKKKSTKSGKRQEQGKSRLLQAIPGWRNIVGPWILLALGFALWPIAARSPK